MSAEQTYTIEQVERIAQRAAQIAIDAALNTDNGPEYPTLAHAAKAVGVSARSLSERIADGRIPEECVVWIADMRRVHMRRLRAFIDSGGWGGG